MEEQSTVNSVLKNNVKPPHEQASEGNGFSEHNPPPALAASKAINTTVSDTTEYDRQNHSSCNSWLCNTCYRYSKTAQWLLFWMCCIAAVQGMVVNGFINTSITTIEKRFNLRSRSTGMIAGSYDIMCLFVSVPMSYMGSRPGASKSRWVGTCLIIMGIGSFIFVSPHFIVGPYEQSTDVAEGNISTSGDSGLCSLSRGKKSECDPDSESWVSNFQYVFVLAQMVQGFGAVPIYTIGVAFIDESVTPQMSSLYLGIFYAMSVVGPAFGYALGSTFLQTYIDAPYIDPPAGVNSSSDRWLGAWWIGFFLSGTLSLILAIPILCTPAVIPRNRELLAPKELEEGGEKKENMSISRPETHEDEENTLDVIATSSSATIVKMDGLGAAVWTLLHNVTYLALSVAESTEAFLVSGLAAFLPKLIESQFGSSASMSALLVGAMAIPAGGGGTFLGGYVIKRFNMKTKPVIKLCLVVSLISLAFCFTLFVYCKNDPFAGVNVQYDPQSSLPAPPNLYSFCNKKCGCEEVAYNPICGSDGRIYYSPCHAGCASSLGDQQNQIFTECSCITLSHSNLSSTTQPSITSLLPGQAIHNTCPNSCGLLGPFLFIIFVLMFLMFFVAMPNISGTLRCVDEEFRSLALGLQGISFRLVGTIPAPIIFGLVIDQSCVQWQESCGTQGSCVAYDNYSMSRYIIALAFGAKIITCISFSIALLYHIPHKSEVEEASQQDSGDHNNPPTNAFSTRVSRNKDSASSSTNGTPLDSPQLAVQSLNSSSSLNSDSSAQPNAYDNLALDPT